MRARAREKLVGSRPYGPSGIDATVSMSMFGCGQTSRSAKCVLYSYDNRQ